MDIIDLKNGETIWEVLKENMPLEIRNKVEMMVKTIGVKATFDFCKFNYHFPKEISDMLMMALNYLEYTYQTQSTKQ